MLEDLCAVLGEKCRLEGAPRLLVAVSGGPDSLCLLHILWKLGYPLVVAHLDHALRPESQAEAQSVGRIAEAMGLPFIVARQNVAAFAQARGLALEEAARLVRYRFLFEQAQQQAVQVVAVGHTADDQVETVLMHLLRGSGLSGLRGMVYHSLPNPWSKTIPLIRPLLGVWREQVLAYIQEQGLSPVLDASNLDTRFYRNRLRHELTPYLESYNPAVRQVIWRMADTLGGDYAVLEQFVEQAWRLCVQAQGQDYVALSTARLKEQPLGVQRRLARRAIAQLRPGLRDIDYAAVERLLDFAAQPAISRQADLAAGLRLLLEGQTLWLAGWQADLPVDNWPQLAVGGEISLPVPGLAGLQDGWRIRAELAADAPAGLPAARQQALDNLDPFQAWLDLDSLALPLNIRTRRPGDRFSPLGMGGHSLKLADFMVSIKLPRRARAAWPLVCSQDAIAWLPGYRIGQEFRVRENTQRIVRLFLERKSGSALSLK